MDTWQLLSLSGMIFSELPLGASGEASGDKQSTQAGATGAGVADQQPPASVRLPPSLTSESRVVLLRQSHQCFPRMPPAGKCASLLAPPR